MSFEKAKKDDCMKEPLVQVKSGDSDKKGIGGIIFPADHIKVPVSAFVNPKNPDKVDTETLDPEGACFVVTTSVSAPGSELYFARKEIIAGSICIGLLVTAALAFLGGLFSLSHLVDYSSTPTRYHGWCAVPYNFGKEFEVDDLLSKENSPYFFHEKFTVDAEHDEFQAEIEVPDFKGGRHGRFLHDFRRNLTAIIDVTGGRCFVMPLDTQHVMRPSSLVDVLTQMSKGRYQVDTKIVRKTMRVVWPPLRNHLSLGSYIANSCGDRDTFLLEKTTFVSDTLEIHPALKRRSPFDFRVKRDVAGPEDGGIDGPVAMPVVEQEQGMKKKQKAAKEEGQNAKKVDEGEKGDASAADDGEDEGKYLKFTEFAGHDVVEFDIVGLDGPSPVA